MGSGEERVKTKKIPLCSSVAGNSLGNRGGGKKGKEKGSLSAPPAQTRREWEPAMDILVFFFCAAPSYFGRVCGGRDEEDENK